VAPGSGVIMCPPVSVCHQVSTIGHFSRADDAVIPHPRLGVDRLADGAEHRRLERSCLVGCSSPHFMKARIAVGAV
jgi:hypothetical protein